MTNRTMCTFAVSFLLGTAWSMYDIPGLVLVFVLLLIYLAVSVMRRQDKYVVSDTADREQRGSGLYSCVLWCVICRISVCLLCFCAGSWRCETQQQYRLWQEQLAERLSDGKVLTVEGFISKKEEKEEYTIYYLTDTVGYTGNQVFPGNGILLYTSDHTFVPGSRLWAQGTYESFSVSSNEGNFNQKKYYQSRKIEYKLKAEQVKELPGKKIYLQRMWMLRCRLGEVLRQCMPQREAGVLIAMITGDKTMLLPEIKELYQDAGISHVLAISGVCTLSLVSPRTSEVPINRAFQRLHSLKSTLICLEILNENCSIVVWGYQRGCFFFETI